MANAHLLIVDPQNDFCDIPQAVLPKVAGNAIHPALPVPGGHSDMVQLARFIENAGTSIQDVTITLDSHPYSAIERTTFWVDAQGNEIAPYTVVTLEDVQAGRYMPRHHEDEVRDYLRAMQAKGGSLMVWPVHCVTGSWGHNIHTAVADQVNAWEVRSGRSALKVAKGEYALSEHFGAFEAEVPIDDEPTTQYNTKLATRLSQDQYLLIAGEASSHCVAASFDQLQRYRDIHGTRTQLILLIDCMSPVAGFEKQEAAFFARAMAADAMCLPTEEALKLIA